MATAEGVQEAWPAEMTDAVTGGGAIPANHIAGHQRLVVLEGGLPWGFRIQGGSDTGFPLRIARVNPGSKAALQGVREGDLIVSMNDQSTESVTNGQAHALLKDAGPTLRLALKPNSTLTRRLFKSSATTTSLASNKTDDPADAHSASSNANNSGTSVGAVQSSATNSPEHIGNGGATKLLRSGSSSSLLSTAYSASSPKPGVWSPGQQQQQQLNQQQPSPPERDNQQRERESDQQPAAPVWIPASQQPSPKAERREFRPVRLDASALKKHQQQQQQQQQHQQQQQQPGQDEEDSGKRPPTSLPVASSNNGHHHIGHWDSSGNQQQQQQRHGASSGVGGTASASSTPLNTPASEHSTYALTSTSTNYSVLSWDRRTSSYNGGSEANTPTPSLTLPPSSLASTPTSHLPKVPNATVTLLQKAREGQLPKRAAYLDGQDSRAGNKHQPPPPPPFHQHQQQQQQQQQQQLYRSPFEQVYTVQREYTIGPSSSQVDENIRTEQQQRKVLDLTGNKFGGVGPVSPEGVPTALRSGIKEDDHHHWYRRMYESLHRAGGPSDYVTVRYKAGRGRGGGYQSEPENRHRYPDYDSDAGRYATLDRRRQRLQYDSESGSPSRVTEQEVHRHQPGRIEDYEPGRSSIAQQAQDKDQPSQPTAKQPTPKGVNIPSKSFTNFALKESGYESDSQLVFRRRYPESEEGSATHQATDPQEQRIWYRDIQRGGEVPLYGLRKSQPDRPLDGQHHGDGIYGDEQHASGAAHRFAESEVTIHYRSPVRNLQQTGPQRVEMDEEELRQMQAEHMRRVYEQERRRKFLQELEDIESRRHMDNFTPLMKSPIPLNRYDDFLDDQPVPMNSHASSHRDRTPEPKIVARGLYNFVAQNSRELSFSKGDIIFVRRQIDKNWYEGEHNAMIGIFPVNYVEIIPYDEVRMTNKKPSEGKGRAKFNFVAQTPIELSLVKGEQVIISRQVDEHWMEGRIGQRRGIFPISYVEVLQPCSNPLSTSTATSTANKINPPGGSLITNGSLRSSNSYRNQTQYSSMPKSSPASNTLQQNQFRAGPMYNKPSNPMMEPRSEPIMYRALYTYTPQNDDELELQEGDSICVLEKCDDGWYVGTSQRTGLFGTFPGNYVERV